MLAHAKWPKCAEGLCLVPRRPVSIHLHTEQDDKKKKRDGQGTADRDETSTHIVLEHTDEETCRAADTSPMPD